MQQRRPNQGGQAWPAEQSAAPGGPSTWNLKPKPDKFRFIFKVVALVIRPGKFDTLEPFVLVEDQQSLKDYGLEVTVRHLPGHTKGSIGILTAEEVSSCGDLMDSMGKPSLQFFIDDTAGDHATD